MIEVCIVNLQTVITTAAHCEISILLVTGRNEVVAKVMFLHVSVILLTGGVSREPPQDQGEPPQDQGEPPPGPGRPPGTKETPPPPRREEQQHTVNERPVRILLECILVLVILSSTNKSFLDIIQIIYTKGDGNYQT